MLPIVDSLFIRYAVKSCRSRHYRNDFCHRPNKRAIEDHFDKAYELEKELEADNKHALLNVLNNIKPKNVECFYVRQAEALGLGHAVLCAERMVHNQAFAVILADDLLDSKTPVMRQMTQLHARHG